MYGSVKNFKGKSNVLGLDELCVVNQRSNGIVMLYNSIEMPISALTLTSLYLSFFLLSFLGKVLLVLTHFIASFLEL